MEYLKGYRVFRDDPEWGKKTLNGMLLLFSTMVIPVLGQAVLVGWQAVALRRAVRGQDAPLPRLDLDMQYLGKLLNVGFKGFIVRFIWSLPVMLLAGSVVVCGYFGTVVLLVSSMRDGGGEETGLAMACCVAGGLVLLVPLLAVLGIPAGVAAMRAELTDDMSQGMRFGEVMAFSRAMFRPLLMGSLVLTFVGGLLGVLGLLACYVGVFAVAVMGLIAQAHFMAQVYRAWVAQGGEELPIGPDLG